MVIVVSVAIEWLKVQTLTDETLQAWDFYLGVIDRIAFIKMRMKHILTGRTDPFPSLGWFDLCNRRCWHQMKGKSLNSGY